MYQAYYKKQRRKSIIIITFLVLFSLISTYLIYEKFANSRDKDYDTGKMEVVFHEKNGNEISLDIDIPYFCNILCTAAEKFCAEFADQCSFPALQIINYEY